MKFKRSLNPQFITALNDLYIVPNSWWRKIVDDREVFILIRNNEVRVQANGGLLMDIKQNAQKKLICSTHEEFLSLRTEKDPYVTLGKTSTSPPKRVEGLLDFVKHYSKVKRRINTFTGDERRAVQQMANKNLQVVDLEIGLEGELKEDGKKKSVPRIDMAAIADNGTLVFFEVKLFNNGEIRSTTTPKVVDQLNKYEKLIKRHTKEILAGYQDQHVCYSKLKGDFFEKRVRKFRTMKLHPQARLIITGFDSAQRQLVLKGIRDNIENQIGWATGCGEIITIGSHTNIGEQKLFKGIR